MSKYEFFTASELRCRCGKCQLGENDMDERFMLKIVGVRKLCDFVIPVNSAIRCPEYNDQIYVNRGHEPGTHREGPHTTGQALDVGLFGAQAVEFIIACYKFDIISEGDRHLAGYGGLGIHQRGPHKDRYVHIDMLKHRAQGPRPWVWTY